ncbi:hypothetical protein M0805_001517 [Coniferiporia weirii]|nr:hypothetical protein M0805_001517 [Coniferiporia weirii]
MSQPGTHSGTDQEFLYLKEVKVDFRGNRSSRPISVKLESGEDVRRSPRFGKDTMVDWELGNYFRIPVPANLSISIEEVHKIKRNKDIVTFNLGIASANAVRNDTISVEAADGRALAKLTFVSPTNELVQRLVEEAQTAVGNKKVFIESLGKAGKVLDVLMKFTDLASDIHPAINAALKVVDILYEHAKGQEECHGAATELMKDLASFLPFLEDDGHDIMKNDRIRQTIRKMLELFCDISGSVIEYSRKGMLGDLFSSNGDKVDSLRVEFQKLRGTYDWSVKMEVWRSVISTERHMEDNQLRQLHPAGQADYDIGRRCLEGTRAGVLDRIEAWAASESKLFWLHGIAGSGKSAIANSAAHMFRQQQQFAGCFFCKRDDPECRDPKNIMPTLAYHFSKWHMVYRSIILSIIKGGDELRLAKSLQWQFTLLFKEPLKTLATTPAELPPKSLIIVIDGIDECGDLDSRSELAEMLSEVANVVPWLKVFVTGRPLPELQHVFLHTAAKSQALDVNNDIASGHVQNDILQYTRFCAKMIKLNISEEHTAALASKASGLFIWTFTAFAFLRRELNTQKAISRLLAQNSAGSQESKLDSIYTLVLHDISMESENAQIVRAVLSIIVCTAKNKPLPEDALLEFLSTVQIDLDQVVLKATIDSLQAVLYRDTSKGGAIRVCHPSFLDFMNSQMRSHDYWTEPTSMDSIMATRCLQIMITQLKFNISGIWTSYFPNYAFPGLQGNITSSGLQIGDQTLQELLGKVLCHPRALFWLECLSIMGELKSGLDILEKFSKHYKQSGVKAYIACQDLYRLLTANYTAMSVSTPHIYISALSWAPTESFIAKQLYPYFSNQPLITSGKESNWKTTLWTANADSGINDVAYSPDGRYIVSGSRDELLRIWDAQTGSTVGGPLMGHSGSVLSVSYSPNGRHIVSGSSDKTLRIWDVQTENAVGRPLSGHSGSVQSVAYSPDGRHIVSGSSDKTLIIWDAQNGSSVGQPLTGHSDWVRSVAYSSDGRHIISGSSDKTLRIWDTQTKNPVGRPLTGHSGSILSVAYSFDAKHIVSGSSDMTLRIWDAQTGKAVGEPLVGHQSSVLSVSYSLDGRYIVSGSSDETLRVWDACSRSAVGEPLTSHSGSVCSVACSPDGRHTVSGSDDKTLRIWDIHSGSPAPKESVIDKSYSILSVAYSPDGMYIASGSSDKALRIWDAYTGRPVRGPLVGHSGLIYSVNYSPNGRQIVTGSDDKTLRIWDAQTGSTVGGPLVGHSGFVYSVAYSPNGKHITSGSSDKTLRIWNAQTGIIIGEPLIGHSDWVRSVAYSPNGMYIVSGSDDKTLRIWDAQTGVSVGGPLMGHSGFVYSVAYSFDGKHIVSGSDDKTLRVWDSQTGCAVGGPLTGHSDWVRSVSYCPDGKYIISGSDDGTLRIWDAHNGSAVGESLTGHSGHVVSVSSSADGKHVVSGSSDGTLRVWDASGAQTGPKEQYLYSSCGVNDDGWMRSPSGKLLLWVPHMYHAGIFDMSKICIPEFVDGKSVRVDWKRLSVFSGPAWVTILEQY